MTAAQAKRRYRLRYRTFCRKLERDWRRWCRQDEHAGRAWRYRQPAIEQAILRLRTNASHDDWRQAVRDQLCTLTVLDVGWDGYAGYPVSADNAAFALRLLTQVYVPGVPAPQIVSGTGGDIQIEWHTATTDIELHVKGPSFDKLIIYYAESKETIPC